MKRLIAFLLMVFTATMMFGCDDSIEQARATESTKISTAEDIAPYPYTQKEKFIKRKQVSEPSGVAFHRARKSLIVVSDEGRVYEFDLTGKLKGESQKSGDDIEGVTVDNQTGKAYLISEDRRGVFAFDLTTMKRGTFIGIPDFYQGKRVIGGGNEGLESIAFVPIKGHKLGGVFYVTNQSFERDKKEVQSNLIRVELDFEKPAAGKITGVYPMGITDLAGMFYDEKSSCLYIASDDEDLLMQVSLTGEVMGKWTLPGKDQEGVTLDDQDRLYIAQDSGRVLRLSGKAFPRIKQD